MPASLSADQTLQFLLDALNLLSIHHRHIRVFTTLFHFLLTFYFILLVGRFLIQVFREDLLIIFIFQNIA